MFSTIEEVVEVYRKELIAYKLLRDGYMERFSSFPRASSESVYAQILEGIAKIEVLEKALGLTPEEKGKIHSEYGVSLGRKILPSS